MPAPIFGDAASKERVHRAIRELVDALDEYAPKEMDLTVHILDGRYPAPEGSHVYLRESRTVYVDNPEQSDLFPGTY